MSAIFFFIFDQELFMAAHLIVVRVLVGATLFKKPKPTSFQIGSG